MNIKSYFLLSGYFRILTNAKFIAKFIANHKGHHEATADDVER